MILLIILSVILIILFFLKTNIEKWESFSRFKNIVFYCYYEKNQEYKDNLKFFLHKGIDPENYYVFIINGDITVDIPLSKNIRVITRPNIGYDFGAYSDALKIINTDEYDYIFFINTSVRGPFLPTYFKDKWTKPFIDMINDKTKLVGTTICISNDHQHMNMWKPPYPHVQSMMFAMDQECLQFFKYKGLFNQQYEEDIVKLIARFELTMSMLVLSNGWNIGCLVKEYKDIDYNNINDFPGRKDQLNIEHNGDINYPMGCFGRTPHPFEIIFIKTNRDMCPNEIKSLSINK